MDGLQGLRENLQETMFDFLIAKRKPSVEDGFNLTDFREIIGSG